MAEIDNARNLSFKTDATTDIRGRRIINFCIHTPQGVFFLDAQDTFDVRQTAENVATWVKKQILDIARNDVQKVNGIVTDTCATMRAVWRILAGDSQLSHVFFIPCTAHVLQLLIKDIIQYPEFADAITSVGEITLYFARSPLEQAKFRQIQIGVSNNQVLEFISPVATRWGSHLASLQRLIRLRSYLSAYMVQHPTGLKSGLITKLSTDSWWRQIEILCLIIRPITIALTKSERPSFGLSDLYTEWGAIRTALGEVAVTQADIGAYIVPKVTQRWQYMDCSALLLAHMLNSANVNPAQPIGKEIFAATVVAVERYGGPDSLVPFIEFIEQRGEFEKRNLMWKPQYVARPELFWSVAKSFSQSLAQLALRVLDLLTTSTASERNFSVFQSVVTKRRSRLHFSTANKLVYVKQNDQALKKLNHNWDTPLELDSFPNSSSPKFPLLQSLDSDSSEDMELDMNLEELEANQLLLERMLSSRDD